MDPVSTILTAVRTACNDRPADTAIAVFARLLTALPETSAADRLAVGRYRDVLSHLISFWSAPPVAALMTIEPAKPAEPTEPTKTERRKHRLPESASSSAAAVASITDDGPRRKRSKPADFKTKDLTAGHAHPFFANRHNVIDAGKTITVGNHQIRLFTRPIWSDGIRRGIVADGIVCSHQIGIRFADYGSVFNKSSWNLNRDRKQIIGGVVSDYCPIDLLRRYGRPPKRAEKLRSLLSAIDAAFGDRLPYDCSECQPAVLLDNADRFQSMPALLSTSFPSFQSLPTVPERSVVVAAAGIDIKTVVDNQTDIKQPPAVNGKSIWNWTDTEARGWLAYNLGGSAADLFRDMDGPSICEIAYDGLDDRIRSVDESVFALRKLGIDEPDRQSAFLTAVKQRIFADKPMY